MRLKWLLTAGVVGTAIGLVLAWPHMRDFGRPPEWASDTRRVSVDPTPPAVPGTGVAAKTPTPDPEPGGPAKAPRFDDEYVYRAMLADLGGLAERDVKNARYLSLHHVAAVYPGELAAARTDFEGALRSVMKAGAPIHQVDAAGTVYRIDLESSGWGYKPFVALNEAGWAVGPLAFNLYDLVLLEYPHAVLPGDSGPFDRLAETFLAVAGQVRPIAFVRGDWFVATVLEPRLARDLALCMTKPIPLGLDPRTRAKPPAVREGGLPARGPVLPALDAWYAADSPDPGVVKNVAAEILDVRGRRPRDVFHEDDQFLFRAEVSRILGRGKTTYLQFVYVNLWGQVEERSRVNAFPEWGVLDSREHPQGGFAAEYGRESVRTYFAHHNFGPGVLWRARIENGRVERLVHNFFPLRKAGDRTVVDMAAAKITRKTVEFEIAPRK